MNSVIHAITLPIPPESNRKRRKKTGDPHEPTVKAVLGRSRRLRGRQTRRQPGRLTLAKGDSSESAAYPLGLYRTRLCPQSERKRKRNDYRGVDLCSGGRNGKKGEREQKGSS